MSLSHSAIHRSLEKLAFSISVQSTKKANAGNAYNLTEVIQQYQIDLKGVVNVYPIFEEVKVPFQERFYDVLGQRDSNHSEPHFTYGLVLDPSSVDVLFTAYVIDWDTDPQGNFIAGNVRMGIYNPTLSAPSQFTGRLHTTFQGYSAPTDTVPEDDGAAGILS